MNRNVMSRQMFAKGGAAGFPDLSGDGKVTQKDILMGRGVPMQMGGDPMAAQMAAMAPPMGGAAMPPAPPMAGMPVPPGMPMEQATMAAMDQGIDPAILEGMLQQAAGSFGNLDEAAETDDYEQVINSIRGDEMPLQERRMELAGIVGDSDAAQTPESVLTLVQPIMQIAAVDQGIGSMAPEAMNTPIEGDMAGGIMSTVNMAEEEPMPGPGGPAPVNFNQGGPVIAMQEGGSPVEGRLGEIYGVPDPRALELFQQDKALYNQLIGVGDQKAAYDEQKKMTQSQMLFDIAQGALAFATPGDRQMSAAERLAGVAQPVLGNISARSGELLKFKQGQDAQRRQLDMAALQSSQAKLGVEKKSEIDAAAASALAERQTVEQAAEYAQELLLQSNKFSFQREQGETEQEYALRLAKDLRESRTTLANLESANTEDQIRLRNELEAQEARLAEAHDLVLQSNKFDFTTSERMSSQDFKSELQNAIDAASASRQALKFENDAKTIAQRAELDRQLAELNSSLRVAEKAVDLDNTLKVAGVKNSYELDQMDRGHDFNLALADHKGTIAAAAAQNQQLATAAENALDRAARENLQITAQNFKALLQEDMQDFTGSESEKDRLLKQLQNDVLNGFKERGLNISQGNLDLATLRQIADESMAVRKQAFAEAEAKADRLAPSLKVIDNDLVLFNPADNSAVSVFQAESAPTEPVFKVIRNMGNQTTRVVDITTASGRAAIEAANNANAGGTQRFTVSNMGSDTAPTAKAFAIQGLGNVLSYDGGRTYLNAEGQSVSMPTTGVNPLSDTIAFDIAAKQRTMLRAGRQAEALDEQLGIVSRGGTRDNPQPLSSEEAGLLKDAMYAARNGTGPYAGFAVFLDNTFGAFVPQLRGAFQDTQANRQFLRGVNILTRSALVVSPRFPVAEMEKVAVLFADPDSFFANPETEAQKFVELKRLAITQKRANLQALSDGIQDDAIRQNVLSNNFEIDRLLNMLATVPLQSGEKVDSATIEALRQHIRTQKK